MIATIASAATSNHVHTLRRIGRYDCRPASLELPIRNGIVTPADPDAWSQADVDAAAEHFEDCQVFTPYAAMCETLGWW